MTTADLQQAQQELEDATRTAEGDVRDSISDTAAAFADFAAGDREVDHAVLDEHLNTLRQARERADGQTADHLDRALDHAEAHREALDRT